MGKRNNIFFLILFFLPIIVFAHPGGRDSNGCHVCRTNCERYGLAYNEFHCHATATATPPTIISPSPVIKPSPAPEAVLSPTLTADFIPPTSEVVLDKRPKYFFKSETLLWFLSALGVGILAALGFLYSRRV